MHRTALWATCLALLSGAVSGCFGGADGQDSGASSSPTSTSTLVVAFSFQPSNPFAGQPVQFTDESRDDAFDLAQHAWDFGDGQATTDIHPVYAYAQPGIYRVALRVKNAAGVEATATQSIAVRAAPDPTDPAATSPPGGGPAPLPLAFPRFGDPVTVRGNNGGEPTLAIDSAGRIYVAPVGELYRSDDGGKSFRELTYPVVVSGDSHVVVDGDDRVWVSDLGGVTPPILGSTTVFTSTDQGQTWTAGNPAASDTISNDRQWLAVTQGGRGYLLYRSCTVYAADQGCFSVGSVMTRTTDAGLSWTPLGRFFEWDAYPFVSPKDGTLYVVQVVNGENAIDVATSRDGATTFQSSRVAQRKTAPGSIFVVGAADDAGNAYVVWIDKDTSQHDVWMSYSTNQGAKWSTPALVSSGLGTSVFPWVAAGADGRLAVAWYGTDSIADPDSVPADGQWSVYVAYSDNAHAAQPRFVQTRAAAAVHRGPICTGGTGCEQSDRDLLDFLNVAIDPEGRIALAYGEDKATATTKTQFQVQVDGPLAR